MTVTRIDRIGQPSCSALSAVSIGFDIGGWSARAAPYYGNADQIQIESLVCMKNWTLDGLIHWIAESYQNHARGDRIPMGLAVPGVVQEDVVLRSVNVPWLEGAVLSDLVASKIGRRPLVMTDASAATWGEYLTTDPRPRSFAHLRLGTGVGCGLVVEGKPVPTDPMRRTHWPMLIVDHSPEAALCPCGLRGCLEIFAGGKALEDKLTALGVRNMWRMEKIRDHAKAAAAQDILKQAADAVCVAIENLVKQYHVDYVALGGGVCDGLPQLVVMIQEVAGRLELPVTVRKGRLGGHAGVFGAAVLAKEESRG